jgi:hypothetical protein
MAAEDEDQRPPVEECLQRHGAAVFRIEERERWQAIARAETFGLPVEEERREHGRPQLAVLEALHVSAVLVVDETLHGRTRAGAHAPIVEIG